MKVYIIRIFGLSDKIKFNLTGSQPTGNTTVLPFALYLVGARAKNVLGKVVRMIWGVDLLTLFYMACSVRGQQRWYHTSVSICPSAEDTS